MMKLDEKVIEHVVSQLKIELRDEAKCFLVEGIQVKPYINGGYVVEFYVKDFDLIRMAHVVGGWEPNEPIFVSTKGNSDLPGYVLITARGIPAKVLADKVEWT